MTRNEKRSKKETMSISNLSPRTRLCALIGNPVEHSLSPAIHNRAFEELGLDFVYLAFRVEDVGAALAGMRALENFRGMSVTIPHKVTVIKHLDEVTEVDRQIGSVNTVVNENGRLLGFGSDGPGARQALLHSGATLVGETVVILGSGGAARAIAFDLAHQATPSSMVILGVLPEEVRNLVSDLARKTGVNVSGDLINEKSLDQNLAEAKVLIHATPVGMHPKVDQSVVPSEYLHAELSVMDIVYNPLQTKLLRDAEKKGLRTISGVEMFVNQAVVQFEAWTGKEAPREIMRQVVLRHLRGQ